MATPRARLTPGAALLPLRLFLGGTFVYAGVQKLTDPGFLHPGSPTYIGTQLHDFAAGTPGGFLLRWFALPMPAMAGVGVALIEIAVGVLVTTGLLTRAAAAVGLGLNLTLFLTATWNTTPYFLGSDIVFVFAWLPFVLVGAAEQPAVDNLLARTAAARRVPRPSRRMQVHGAAPRMDRRALLRRGLAAAGTGTLAIAGMAILARGSLRRGATALAAGAQPAPVHHAQHHRAHTESTARHTAATEIPTGAVALEPSTSLAPGQAATYSDPTDGSPDIVVRHADGSLSAMSAVCTHAGCQVGFQSGVLYCPCHGSQFDAGTGAVLQGPAVLPLPRRRVIERGGKIYAIT